MLKLLTQPINRSLKLLFSVIFLTSVVALILSFFVEFFSNLTPCLLCNIQRGIYGLLGFSSLSGIVCSFTNLSKRLCQICLMLLLIVASYHTLVQFGILRDRCRTETQVESIEAYKKSLEASKASSGCADSAWKILNVPISVWNGLLALSFLALFSQFRLAFNRR